MNLIKLKASKNDEGRTLFKFLVKNLNNVPVSAIEKVFRLKDVKVNGIKTNNKSYSVVNNDAIWIYGLEDVKKNVTYQTKIDFKVIYEDKNILVINKPINVSMHGFNDSLDNQVLSYLNYKQTDSFIPSSIGRLDRVTSGLIIYAKTYSALVQLNNKINLHEKYYLLKSDFPWPKKEVIFYARKNKKTNDMELFDTKPGLLMHTIFFQDKNKKYALIKSGKKHQIRLTLSHLGYPIYGDKKYGSLHDKRVYLHSYKIVFHNLENELDYLNDTQFVCDIKW